VISIVVHKKKLKKEIHLKEYI